MESLVFCQIHLLPKDASDILPVFGAQDLPFALAPSLRFPSFHATECFGVFPSWVVFPNDVLSTNCASEMASVSQSGLPKCQFCLLHSLHGPWSARFDRGPRCSLLAANCHYPEVFRSLIVHKSLKSVLIWCSHRTWIIFMDPLRITWECMRFLR